MRKSTTRPKNPSLAIVMGCSWSRSWPPMTRVKLEQERHVPFCLYFEPVFVFAKNSFSLRKYTIFTYTDSAIHQDSMGQGYVYSAFLPDCLSWCKLMQNWVNQRWFLMKLVEISECYFLSFPNFFDYFVSIVTENFKIFSSPRNNSSIIAVEFWCCFSCVISFQEKGEKSSVLSRFFLSFFYFS